MAIQDASARWRTQKLSTPDWEKRKAMVFANTTLLSVLDEILREMVESVNKEEVSDDQYESPSWAYKQAHRNGQKNVLKELSKLTQHLRK